MIGAGARQGLILMRALALSIASGFGRALGRVLSGIDQAAEYRRPTAIGSRRTTLAFCGLDRKFAFSKGRVSEQKIKQRQKHVVTAGGDIVVAHVISASELKTGRKPSLHVNPPMDFFSGDEVSRPSHEDT
jgi:hypothetical protein